MTIDLAPLRDELLALPADPVSRTHPRNWLFRIKRTMDLVGHGRHVQAEFFRKINPYPSPFRHVRFDTEDGVRIAAWYGPPHEQGPASMPRILTAKEAKAAARSARAAEKRAKSRPSGREAGGDAARVDAARAPGKRARGNGEGRPAEADGKVRKGRAAADDKVPKGRAAADGKVRKGRAAADDKVPKGRGAAPEVPFGLVIVPGMFSTKDDSVHKRRAIWIWRHWKIPVICIDMRAFGESTGIATGGWKEAYDVHAAAKFLKQESGCRRVGVMAESMGGASTLNALAHDEESGTRVMDGGALCFSAFVDLRDAVHYISTQPPKLDPFYAQWAAFRRLLSYRSHGGYERFDEYLDDAARVNGLSSFDEMADLANPKWKTSLIKTPVLLVHAMDDPVVPVRHARRMERYAKDYPHIQVMAMAWGGHTGFEGRDPHWFWEVVRTYFGRINGLELPSPLDTQAKVVESVQA